MTRQPQAPQEPVEREVRHILGVSAPIFWTVLVVIVIAVVVILIYTLS